MPRPPPPKVAPSFAYKRNLTLRPYGDDDEKARRDRLRALAAAERDTVRESGRRPDVGAGGAIWEAAAKRSVKGKGSISGKGRGGGVGKGKGSIAGPGKRQNNVRRNYACGIAGSTYPNSLQNNVTQQIGPSRTVAKVGVVPLKPPGVWEEEESSEQSVWKDDRWKDGWHSWADDHWKHGHWESTDVGHDTPSTVEAWNSEEVAQSVGVDSRNFADVAEAESGGAEAAPSVDIEEAPSVRKLLQFLHKMEVENRLESGLQQLRAAAKKGFMGCSNELVQDVIDAFLEEKACSEDERQAADEQDVDWADEGYVEEETMKRDEVKVSLEQVANVALPDSSDDDL